LSAGVCGLGLCAVCNCMVDSIPNDVCGSWFGILGRGSNVDTNVGFGRMTMMVVASEIYG
jgi:hypothetical protein